MNISDLNETRTLKVRIRLDFKGQSRPGRFLFGSKPVNKVAEEIREQQIAHFRNVPVQGVYIEDIDASIEVYTVWDDVTRSDVAYAPIILTVMAENMVDLVRFVAREEFRKIDVLEPGHQHLTRYDMERLLFKMHEEFRSYIYRLEKIYSLR